MNVSETRVDVLKKQLAAVAKASRLNQWLQE